MSLESDIFDTLKGLVASRCYPDVAPAGVARPYIVWQQVGGEAFNFLEAGPVGKRGARIQVTCWADTRVAAANLSRSAEDALVASSLNPTVLGAMVADFDQETGLRGARQDFSLTY
jgi:hypothetical protein